MHHFGVENRQTYSSECDEPETGHAWFAVLVTGKERVLTKANLSLYRVFTASQF